MEISLPQRALAVVSALMALAGAGCATRAPAAPSRGCGEASAGAPTGSPAGALSTASAGALPAGILAVSAVPGTRQAWAVGDAGDPDPPHHSYLMRFSGVDWFKVASFGPSVALAGVSAMSGRSAWVWGTGYLALVSGGVVRRLRSPWLKGVSISAVASDGTADTWVVGGSRAGTLVEHWDGRSWHRTALPAGSSAASGWPTGSPQLSVGGRASAWMVVSHDGAPPVQWVLHWNGRAWSRSYAPSARLYGGPFGESGPFPVPSVAGSGGRAWVVYTEQRVPKGVPAWSESPATVPTSMLSAYFDGSTWSPVRIPGRPIDLSDVAMAGSDAWAVGYYNGPTLLCSHLAAPWQKLPVPRLRQRPCALGLHMDISPPYLIQTSRSGSNNCGFSFGFVYDGRRWRPVTPG